MKQSAFQFIQPYLTHLEFSLTDKFSPQKDKVLLNTSISIIKCNKKSEEHKIDVVLGVEIGGDEPSNPFHIRAAMQGTFKWDETVDNETLEKLLSQNAPSVLLSYLRPIIANITNASPLPAYNMPFLNFTEEDVDIVIIDKTKG